MRCREARKRISAFVRDGSHPKGWGTPGEDETHPKGWGTRTHSKLWGTEGDTLTPSERDALTEHLERCHECARLVEIERLMTNDIEQVRSVGVDHPIEVEQVRQRIRVREAQLNETRWGVRIMKQVGDTIYSRPRLSMAMVAIAVLAVASVLVPIKTERPIGYTVAFAAPAPDLALNADEASRLLGALDVAEARVSVSESGSEIKYSIEPLRDSVKVRRLMAVLDSLGGKQIRRDSITSGVRTRTIWHILLDAIDDNSARDDDREVVINLKELLPDNALLWMPVDERPGDSMRGLLMDKQGDRTKIHMVGGDAALGPDDCGWNQYLNNSVMHTERPDGVQDTFRLYDLNDVRRLEKLGYNFATMKWESPPRMPIPGMGPRLNEVETDESGDRVTVEVMVPQATEVTVLILADDGQVVRTIRDCIMLAGISELTWDGRDESGEPVALGRYVCRFTAGDYVETKEFMLGRH